MDQKKQKLLLSIVQTWHPSESPEYRGFRCANCQKYINEAWHHWLKSGGFCVPVHLCSDCEPKIQDGTIAIDETKVPPINTNSFGKTGQLTDSTRARFKEIVGTWPLLAPSTLKAFVCDECARILEIDPVGNQRRGYHVWWKMDDQTLAELHFHRECGQRLGIKSKEE